MPPPSATITLYVDATGVGQPVVDLLTQAGLPVVGVYFTHGDRLVENRQAGTVSLGTDCQPPSMIARAP